MRKCASECVRVGDRVCVCVSACKEVSGRWGCTGVVRCDEGVKQKECRKFLCVCIQVSFACACGCV